MGKLVKKIILSAFLVMISLCAILVLTLNLLASPPFHEYTPSKKVVQSTFSLSEGVKIDECIAFKNVQRDMGYFPHLLFQIKTQYLLARIIGTDNISINDYILVEDSAKLEHLKGILAYVSEEFQKSWIMLEKMENCKIYAKDVEPKYDTPQFLFSIEDCSTIYLIINTETDSTLMVYDQSKA